MKWTKKLPPIPDDAEEREFIRRQQSAEKKAIADRQSRTRFVSQSLQTRNERNHYADLIRDAMGWRTNP